MKVRYGVAMHHLDALNLAQRTAAETTEGPLLVLAGAGAGKTRVIAHRVLEIVRRGTAPERILAITFTNKAASEMRTRVLDLLTSAPDIQSEASPRSPAAECRISGARVPFISTFHSLGLRIIKENAKLLGYKRAPMIYDRADSLREIKAALKSLDMVVEPRVVLASISRQKGQGVELVKFSEKTNNFREEVVAKVWGIYDRALRADNALDFDDLLLRSMVLLRDHEAARQHYQSRWTYVHVDEYQDTNFVQARMMELLVGPQKNICVVGDVDQTIYGWRGAEIKNILSFEDTFPGTRTVVLEENYRSTKTILAAANEIISKNKFRPEKKLFTKNADGDALSLYQAFDETDEALFVTRIVRDGLEAGKHPQDFAVLYRANFQSRAVEEALLGAGIPYQVIGTRFFERKEVKDVLSFVRLALRGPDEELGGADLARIANVPPRGIGKVTLLKILAGRERELARGMQEKVAQLRALLARVRKRAKGCTPSELVRFVIAERGMERVFKEDKLEGAERLENLRELGSLASRYDALPVEEGLEAFLENAALASDQDEMKDEVDAVRLMTVHASKGLEFPVVFVAGLEEGLFPYEREDSDVGDKEEERRLCYVALTRAQQKIYLTYASYRTIFGSKNPTLPSQFLSDIPQDLLALEAPERLGKTIYLD